MIETSRPNLNRGLEKAYIKFAEAVRDQLLTRDVEVDPTLWTEIQNSENEIDLSHFNGKEMFILAIYSWYMPEWIGFLVRVQLEEEWTAHMSELKSSMLSSKELMLSTLQVQEYMNGNDLFGLINSNKHPSMKTLTYYFRLKRPSSSKPVKPVRKRGYNDKGSRRPDHEPEPRYKDYDKILSLDEEVERKVQIFVVQQLWVNRALRNLEVTG